MTSVTTASPVASPARAEQLQPFSLHAREAVGAGAGLEGPAAQAGGPRLADDVGDLQDLLAALDRAGAGDDADVAGADLEAQDLDARRLLLDLGAGHLVGGQDRDHLFDPVGELQGLLGPVPLLPQRGHDGQLGADDDVGPEAEALDALDDVVDLRLARPRVHDDDHGWSPRRRRLTGRPVPRAGRFPTGEPLPGTGG